MTQWVENSELGRDRGPVALGQAWIEVLLRPRYFFARKVAPGDQAPGLTFAAVMVFAAEVVRLATVSSGYPVVAGQPIASAVLWLLALVVLVMPAGIHLTAALQTVILIGTVENRAGVSETVQVLCYSLAPLAFLGIPNVWVQSLAILWSAALLVLGQSMIHDISVPRALVVVSIPGLVLLGYGFGGNADLLTAGELLVEHVDSFLG